MIDSRPWLAAALMVGLVLLACASGVAVRLWFPGLLAWMEALLSATRALGPAGWLIFIGGEVLIAVIGVLPASLFGIVAGAVYGIGIAFALSSVGLALGATISFLASRSLLRGAIIRMLRTRRRLGTLDARVGAGGWPFVCLLRASPVMPFAITSLLLGLSSVRFRDYAIGTLAALPALFGYVCIGRLGEASLAGHAASGRIGMALLGLGAVATVLLSVWIAAMVRSTLREPTTIPP